MSYIASHPDLINWLGTDTSGARWHFVNYGYSESRGTDTFDEWNYLASYTDLITWLGTDTDGATQHIYHKQI